MKWDKPGLAVLFYSLLDVQAIYIPLREYSGYSFFDKWAYYGNVDNTTWGTCFLSRSWMVVNIILCAGNVSYVDKQAARAKRLAYTNTAGNAIIKVDNLTTVPAGPLVHRDSVRERFHFKRKADAGIGPANIARYVWRGHFDHNRCCTHSLRLL